jgi:hypothetical protein
VAAAVEGKLVPSRRGVRWQLFGLEQRILLQAANKIADAIVVPALAGAFCSIRWAARMPSSNPAKAPENSSPVPGPDFLSAVINVTSGRIRRAPRHPVLWQGRHDWTSPGEWHVETSSGNDPATGLEISKSLRLDPDTGAVHLMQWVENKRPTELTILRDRTLCPTGGFVLFRSTRRAVSPPDGRFGEKPVTNSPTTGPHPFLPRSGDRGRPAGARGGTASIGSGQRWGLGCLRRDRLLFVKFFDWFADAA